MPSIAMKVYDLQWFTSFEMDYAEAAAALAADGVDTVFTQNRIDPLPDSGVDQARYLSRYCSRLGLYDDRAWSNALRAEGLAVHQTTATFFDPVSLTRFPDARPVNALGEPDRGIDWYTGVCPTHETYLDWKIDRLRRAVDELAPDGLLLQFTRFPGFWENWTWDPDYHFSAADRYCFCNRCRDTFCNDAGLRLSSENLVSQAREIVKQHHSAWVKWQCQRLVSTIQRIVDAVNAGQRGLEITLNTLPFPASDFDGADVRRTIAGQDLPALAPVIQRFELMTYLQILKRPANWIGAAVEDARRQLPGGQEIVCTLQVAPLYTTGLHAARHREEDVTAGDLKLWASTAIDAGVDGLVFYHWTDFLEDEAAGGSKRTILKQIAGAGGK